MLKKSDITRLQQIRTFIKSNLDKELTLQSIASEFSVSVPTLRRHFKIHYRSPLHHFILQKRMQKALRMLKESNIHASVIARKVGYKRYTTFVHAFSKYHGFPPSKTQSIEQVIC